jgi:hypothetical protein
VASNIIRVAIVPIAYPDRKFTDEKADLLETLDQGGQWY